MFFRYAFLLCFSCVAYFEMLLLLLKFASLYSLLCCMFVRVVFLMVLYCCCAEALFLLCYMFVFAFLGTLHLLVFTFGAMHFCNVALEGFFHSHSFLDASSINKTTEPPSYNYVLG